MVVRFPTDIPIISQLPLSLEETYPPFEDYYSPSTTNTASPPLQYTMVVDEKTPMIRTGSSGHGRKSSPRHVRALQEAVVRAREQTLAPFPQTPTPDPRRYKEERQVGDIESPEERKKKCPFCPQLLCGDHEYNRHYDLLHSEVSWQWQIIDPADKGVTPIFPMEVPLKDCKNCSSGKLYGPNYNTAAHLRRCHFRNSPDSQGEGKRGGSSGGLWPDIRYLEFCYMKEVQVRKVSDPNRLDHKSRKYRRTGLERHTQWRQTGGKKHVPESSCIAADAKSYQEFCQAFFPDANFEPAPPPPTYVNSQPSINTGSGMDWSPTVDVDFNTVSPVSDENSCYMHPQYIDGGR